MSKEFYNYIAKSLISFFKTIDDFIHPGERYCLKLDNQEMVDVLDAVLYEHIGNDAIRGNWIYKPGIYDTYTLKLNRTEVAIISKTIDMTEDFLATLRNAKTTMLMITSAPIDSISKGTGDLTAKGMPFHKDAIIRDIEEYIRNSPLSAGDKAVLNFELNRRNDDIFSDKSSLYEYEGLLSIISSEYVTPENFSGFRLFFDDALPLITNEKDLQERLKNNNNWYERIDRSIRFGNIEDDFEKILDSELIKELNTRKKSLINWDSGLKYTDILKSLEKMEKIKDKPFEETSIDLYSTSLSEYRFEKNMNFFIHPDGTTASKQKKQNILIFNIEKRDNITFEVKYNRLVRTGNVSYNNGQVIVSGRTIRFTPDRDNKPCSFHDIKIEDENSTTKYEYRLCIIDIAPAYLQSIITSYTIQRKKKSGVIRVLGSSGDIIINSGKYITKTETIIEGNSYSCNFDSALCLHVDENLMTDEKQGINIIINLGGIAVPLRVLDEPKNKVGITGLQVFKKKFAKETSFIVTGENAITLGTDEYFAKEDFRQNLVYEHFYVENGCYCAERMGIDLSEKALQLPEYVKQAYDKFIQYFRTKSLIPSLTYYSNDLRELAKQYITAVTLCVKNVQNGLPISDEINDLLKLGTIIGKDDSYEICFTPFHPLNVAYQLILYGENDVGNIRDELAARLSYGNMLPYIVNEEKEPYCVMEQKHSPEWVYFAPLSNKRFKGARAFVPKLIAEKIDEYMDHFSCLFAEIGNKSFRINVINMGDCKEVLCGIILYFSRALIKNSDPDDLTEFIVNVYGESSNSNEFLALADMRILEKVYKASDIKFDSYFSDYDVVNILAKKIKCYYHSEEEEQYAYAHIAFYEMDSNDHVSSVTSSTITSGVMLNSIVSGIPSVYYGNQYKTGFGTKFAKDTPLLNLAGFYNALHRIANSSDPYYVNLCISTAVEKTSVNKMNKIYDSSNWVTFIDPKVDLNFFQCDNEAKVLIIHYSDQYTSSSGYDAITVTRKSKQYIDIISNYLIKKAVQTNPQSVHYLIDMFNAINGDWLLRLISSNSQFPREKMSILSAIKVALAYYYHPNIIWVPISLEELLRVSGATGLSSNDGLISAKKLGFEDGKTSDDILIVGIEKIDSKLKVYLHPIEVKIGQTDSMILKAKEQVQRTSKELLKALWPIEDRYSLQNKMLRNFIMQLVVISSEKMGLYHIWDDQEWRKILNDYREDLLNENYEISNHLDIKMGHGSVFAFNHDGVSRSAKFEDELEIVELTESDGINYMVRTISQIQAIFDMQACIFCNRICNTYQSGVIETETIEANEGITEPTDDDDIHSQIVTEYMSGDDGDEGDEGVSVTDTETEDEIVISDKVPQQMTSQGIKILFGVDQGNGVPLIWEPSNTDKVLHTNTGIIGTMGTGKTQFTKSIITQLYRESYHNVDGEIVGILIFDYKGDYNESKVDFVEETNAKVLKLYHLPYNPLTITQPKVFKPLLPIHVANAFKDTLSKVYSLGAKQENTLFNCIKEAYSRKGILPEDKTTWDKTPPTFSDVYRIYSDDDDIKKNDSLAAALDKLAGFEIFESDPSKTKSLFDMLNGVLVVDLSGYDSDIQNLVVAITLDLFYAQMQASGSSKLNGKYRQLTKIILVDEADNFLHEGFTSLKKILKEGREFGVGTILSTQFLKHFGTGDDDFSKYILTWVVHNVADLKASDIRFVFKTEANGDQEQKLFNDVKKLEKHCSIVKMGNHSQPFYIRDKAFWELISE